MASSEQTTKRHLNKPQPEDFVNVINDICDNMDNLDDAVPDSRKVNGHALNGDITVSKSDVGLGNVDNVQQVPATRKVNNKALSSDINLQGTDIQVSSSDSRKVDAAIANCDSETASLKSALYDITGNAYYDNWSENGKYIALNVTNANPSSPVTTTGNIRYQIIPCSPGDVFCLFITGASSGRAYGFINGNDSNKVLEKADASVTLTKKSITAPANTTALIINDALGTGMVYSGILLEDVKDNISEMKDVQEYDEFYTENVKANKKINSTAITLTLSSGNITTGLETHGTSSAYKNTNIAVEEGEKYLITCSSAYSDCPCAFVYNSSTSESLVLVKYDHVGYAYRLIQIPAGYDKLYVNTSKNSTTRPLTITKVMYEDLAPIVEGNKNKILNTVGVVEYINPSRNILIGFNDFEVGSISNSGALTDSNTRIRTNSYIDISGVQYLTVRSIYSRYQFRIFFYKEGYTDPYNPDGGYQANAEKTYSVGVYKYVRIVLQDSMASSHRFDQDQAAVEAAMLILTNSGQEDPETNLNPVKLRVCSYNVGKYNNGTEPPVGMVFDEVVTKYRRFYSDLNADILGLQEVIKVFNMTAGASTADDEVYDYLYPFKKNTFQQTALKSRYSLYDMETGEFETSGRTYVSGKIRINGKEVFLMSVHLSTGLSDRTSEKAELLDILAEHESFIVFGDFNAHSSDGGGANEYNDYVSQGYHVANCGYLGQINTNVNDPRDNIITSGDIIIANSYLASDGSDLTSDHKPIAADLVFYTVS